MDELELLRRHRPDPSPPPEIVERHRAALRAAIAEPALPVLGGDAHHDGDGVELDLAPAPAARAPRRWPWLAAAAAVVALVATGVAVSTLDDRDDVRSTATTNAPATPAAPSGECGPLPFDLPLPEGFGALTAGASGDGPGAPAAGQLVLHSTSATGTIELRWPSGRESTVVTDRSNADAGMSWTATTDPAPTASGRQAFAMEVHDPALSSAPQCQAMRFVVADDDAEAARLAASALYRALGEPGVGPFGGRTVPLVIGTETAAAAPDVPPCDAPPGVEHVDRVGGPVQLGPFATRELALQAFIDSRRIEEPDPFGVPTTRATVAERGYVRTDLPDGSIAYVHRVGLGVTVVHVIADDGGWTVDRWEATGC